MTTTTTANSVTESVELSRSELPSAWGLSPGDVLGRYEVLFPLATGGMASVYAARLVGEGVFQKAVALKVMLPHLAREERFVAMFMDEAALAARVQSPYVVQVIELGRHAENTLFIAMDLVVGVSLWQVFGAASQQRTRLSVPVASTIIVQAASGLHDAHEACAPSGERLGIVHRDVSPHNVLVGVDGRARITDFGIARAIERTGVTQTGELKGKLSYFSPEQVRCVDLDARSDVFSLGIVAWEMLSGERLFDSPNPLATAQAVAAKPVPRLDAIRSDVPAQVADVVASALERDPARRLSSADAFARSLRAACEASCGLAEPHEVSVALRGLCGPSISDVECALAAAMATPTARYRAIYPARAREKRSLYAALLMALVLAVFSVVVWRSSDAAIERQRASQSASAARDVPPSPAAPSAEPVPAAPPPVVTPSPELVTETKSRRGARGSPRRAAPRRATNTREATESAADAPKKRGSLLRKIEEFDHERAR